ncbi:MAG: Rho termination factor N-terminal domain-containing protein, partial [Clostridia bacterium]|nr:Rho termination factor N-terminal domain-containing protein [Clostridia bacterium]
MREKLETLSLSVLREFAKDKKIKNISSLRKADLIDAILKAQEEEDKQKKEFKDSRPVQKKTVVKPEEHPHVAETGAQASGGVTAAGGVQNTQSAGTGSAQNPSEPKPQRPLEYADGILEVLSEGYGFIRCENFLPGDND